MVDKSSSDLRVPPSPSLGVSEGEGRGKKGGAFGRKVFIDHGAKPRLSQSPRKFFTFHLRPRGDQNNKDKLDSPLKGRVKVGKSMGARFPKLSSAFKNFKKFFKRLTGRSQTIGTLASTTQEGYRLLDSRNKKYGKRVAALDQIGTTESEETTVRYLITKFRIEKTLERVEKQGAQQPLSSEEQEELSGYFNTMDGLML